MYFLQPGQKRFLSSLNPVLLGGFVYFLILFRTTSEAALPSVLRHWDLLLPFVVYVGQRRTIVEGLLLVLFMSHLFSLGSAAPIGLFAVHYLVIFLVARLLVYAIYANSWFSILWLIFLLGLLSRVTLPIVAHFFGHGWPVLTLRNFVPGALILNALFGLVTYGILGVIDRMTFKVGATNIELADRAI